MYEGLSYAHPHSYTQSVSALRTILLCYKLRVSFFQHSFKLIGMIT